MPTGAGHKRHDDARDNVNVRDLDIPPVIQRHLSGAEIKTVAQLTLLTRAEVRSMHGMGEKVTDRLASRYGDPMTGFFASDVM